MFEQNGVKFEQWRTVDNFRRRREKADGRPEGGGGGDSGDCGNRNQRTRFGFFAGESARSIEDRCGEDEDSETTDSEVHGKGIRFIKSP